MKNLYFDKYPKILTQGYSICASCGLTDDVIGARMSGHQSNCTWMISNLPAEREKFQEHEAATLTQKGRIAMDRINARIDDMVRNAVEAVMLDSIGAYWKVFTSLERIGKSDLTGISTSW